MSASRQTTHYDLPLYDGTDVFSVLTDFNGAMEKIDDAIYDAEQSATSAEASVAEAMAKANQAIQSANTANGKANSAITTANNAKDIADTATTLAQSAVEGINNNVVFSLDNVTISANFSNARSSGHYIHNISNKMVKMDFEGLYSSDAGIYTEAGQWRRIKLFSINNKNLFGLTTSTFGDDNQKFKLGFTSFSNVQRADIHIWEAFAYWDGSATVVYVRIPPVSQGWDPQFNTTWFTLNQVSLVTGTVE